MTSENTNSLIGMSSRLAFLGLGTRPRAQSIQGKVRYLSSEELHL